MRELISQTAEQRPRMTDWTTLGLGVAVGLGAAGAVAVGCALLRGEGHRGQDYRTVKSYKKDDPLSNYVNSQNRENAVLGRLRATSAKHASGGMTTGQDVGNLLTLLTRCLGARKVVDVGVFLGCSSFSMALALPEGGRVIACDVSEEYTNTAKAYWEEGGVAEKIELRIKPATETLQELLDGGEAGTYDLVFIDADKVNYLRYYEMGIELLRPGGLVVVDNALWSGWVADPQVEDVHTSGIRAVNERMKTDPRVDYALLTVSDGIGIACKY